MKEIIAKAKSDIASIREKLIALQGKRIRVLSNYNGQPYGRSRPSLKGKEFEIAYVSFDSEGWIFIFVKGERLSIRSDEVEFL